MVSASKEISLIDISPFTDPKSSNNAALRADVVKQVKQSCLTHGFFQILGHGVPSDLISSVFSLSKRFFSLPIEDKNTVSLTKAVPKGNSNRGFEIIGAQTLEKGTQPDLKEGFNIGHEIPLDHEYVRQGKFGHGPNQWPDEEKLSLQGFRKDLLDYHRRITELSAIVMRILALSLDLEEDYFDGFCKEPEVAAIKLLHYPPHPVNAADDLRGAGAHTDFGAITFLLQDSLGGLEVLDPHSKTWISVSPVPNAYVVNLGDAMQRWTNDRYISNVHRVFNRSGKERYSIPFFYDGNLDFPIEPIATCVAEGEKARYERTTMEEMLNQRFGQAYKSNAEK
ncbi:2og-Fe oxygenase family protein [Aulographum hederae CBS 113979]|uniref:2og-Fe oxygenase family protein n=1 Tax=Aulographum hederae CBS 113979 TaxID=1176131 RepID=A0A6G1GJ00_9PEZI|nr:2og-Fe oxygenase family protein [Aulographum hederae CBS 113979]